MVIKLTKRQLEKVDWEYGTFELDHPKHKYAYFDHVYDPDFGYDEWWYFSSEIIHTPATLANVTEWVPIELTEKEKRGILKYGKVIWE